MIPSVLPITKNSTSIGRKIKVETSLMFELKWRPKEGDKAGRLFDRNYEALNIGINGLSQKLGMKITSQRPRLILR